jgi:hypothetical protein
MSIHAAIGLLFPVGLGLRTAAASLQRWLSTFGMKAGKAWNRDREGGAWPFI